MNSEQNEICPYRYAIEKAGWVKREFSPGVVKWWNPDKDDGARYCDTPRTARYICEDYGIAV